VRFDPFLLLVAFALGSIVGALAGLALRPRRARLHAVESRRDQRSVSEEWMKGHVYQSGQGGDAA
jgi:gas vesicle protein